MLWWCGRLRAFVIVNVPVRIFIYMYKNKVDMLNKLAKTAKLKLNLTTFNALISFPDIKAF